MEMGVTSSGPYVNMVLGETRRGREGRREGGREGGRERERESWP